MAAQREGSGHRVLVVDDEQSVCDVLSSGLRARGFDTVCRLSVDHALEEVANREFDVVLTDLELGRASGFEVCERVCSEHSDICVVVMTAFGTLENVVRAIRVGAYDFVTKPLSMDTLALALGRAAQHRRLGTEIERLRHENESKNPASVVGSSSAMRQTSALIARVAPSDATVLITGESGTGKEVLARALHESSGRKGQFWALNCAAVPDALLESELFGHAKGAFTDAHAAYKGLFREADGGTLFLDEITEMPLAMQAKLLRALQERTVRPVGGSKEHAFDTRIVAATNRNIDADVANRKFREDLYYRINVVHIDVPPLRSRGHDVLELAHCFVARAAERAGRPASRIGTEVAERLISYDWPGNVRELENCIEHAVALAVYDEITLNDLPPKIREERAPVLPPAGDPSELPSIRTVEYRYIRKVLRVVNGNKTLAAKVMGFDRRTLYRKLAAFARGGVDDDELS